jgi:hypothetical protein
VTADLATLGAAAQKAQAALAAEQERQALAAAEAAEAARLRSVDWAFRTILAYPGRQIEANDAVAEGMAAFDEAVVADFGSAAKTYLAIVTAMAAANGVAAEYVTARNILRAAGLLQLESGHSPDPVGHLNAPFPSSTLPTFAAMFDSSIGAAAVIAFRLPPAGDPASYSGPAPTEAERQAVSASEWSLSQELEHMLGYRMQHPEHFLANVPEGQQREVEAYGVGRAARGYDADLPKVVIETSGQSRTPTARELGQHAGGDR